MIALFNCSDVKAINIQLLCLIFLLSLFVVTSFPEAKEYYKWKDNKGNTHVTDDITKVPDKYKSQIRIYNQEEKTQTEKDYDKYFEYFKKNISKILIIAGLLFLIVMIYLLLFRTGEMINKIYNTYKLKKNEKLFNKSGIKNMDLDRLKILIKDYYKNRGYRISEKETQLRFIAFFAERGNEKIVVNVNDNLNPVSRRFLNDLDSEKQKFGCGGSAVFTKSWFERDAVELAKSINCSLYDRHDLVRIITDLSISHSQNH